MNQQTTENETEEKKNKKTAKFSQLTHFYKVNDVNNMKNVIKFETWEIEIVKKIPMDVKSITKDNSVR